MTTEEFSNAFDTLVSSYRRFKDYDKKEELDSIEFDEYEKSLWLTDAQNEVVVSLYTGKNAYGESFEVTEELRRYLDSLVKQEDYENTDRVSGMTGISSSSVFYALPSDVAYILYEKLNLSGIDKACLENMTADVYPVTHDEYNRIMRNPFRGPTTFRALRVDCGERVIDTVRMRLVEIISAAAFNKYTIRYLSRPEPIVLEDMPEGVTINGYGVKNECKLDSMLHDTILKHAVQLALASKGIQVNS